MNENERSFENKRVTDEIDEFMNKLRWAEN